MESATHEEGDELSGAVSNGETDIAMNYKRAKLIVGVTGRLHHTVIHARRSATEKLSNSM